MDKKLIEEVEGLDYFNKIEWSTRYDEKFANTNGLQNSYMGIYRYDNKHKASIITGGYGVYEVAFIIDGYIAYDYVLNGTHDNDTCDVLVCYGNTSDPKIELNTILTQLDKIVNDGVEFVETEDSKLQEIIGLINDSDIGLG